MNDDELVKELASLRSKLEEAQKHIYELEHTTIQTLEGKIREKEAECGALMRCNADVNAERCKEAAEVHLCPYHFDKINQVVKMPKGDK